MGPGWPAWTEPLSDECLPQDGGHDSHRGEGGSPLLHPPPPARKFPQPDRQHLSRHPWEGQPPHQAWPSRSSASAGHAAMPSNQYFKKVPARSRRGKPRPDARDYRAPAREQRKPRSEMEAAAGTPGGHKGVKGDGGPSANPTLR